MNFDEISAPSAKELFVHKIETAILSGRMTTGELLPTSRQLAEQMKISLPVVTAGIKDLIRDGFLDVVPRKGVYIADFVANGNLGTLEAIINYTGEHINPEIYKSIFEVRRAVEVPGIKLAIANRTTRHIDDFNQIIDQLRTTNNNRQAAEIFFSFHHKLCLISGNALYPIVFNAFKSVTIIIWENYCKNHGIPSVIDFLCEILCCMEQKDPERAADLLNQVLSDAMDAGFENI